MKYLVQAFAGLLLSQNSGAVPLDSHDINNVPAFSRLGSKILSEARVLEEFEYDNSWLQDYAIQFQGCHSILHLAGEGEGAGINGKDESQRNTA